MNFPESTWFVALHEEADTRISTLGQAKQPVPNTKNLQTHLS
jgi:hypothetical protein